MAKTEEQRSWATTSCAFRVGTWWVDPGLDEISRDGQVIKLEPRMMKLLVRLAQSPAQVISTQHLLSTVWSGVIVGPASVYQAISQLRKVLSDTDQTPNYIVTIPRKGYRLVAPVERWDEHVSGEAQRASIAAPPATIGAERPATRLRWAIGAFLAILVAAAAALLVVRDSERAESQELPVYRVALDNRAIAVLPLFAVTEDEPTRVVSAAMLAQGRIAARDLRDVAAIQELLELDHAAAAIELLRDVPQLSCPLVGDDGGTLRSAIRFASIRNDPRFQALVAKTSAHRMQQRALEAMRLKGEVPMRG